MHIMSMDKMKKIASIVEQLQLEGFEVQMFDNGHIRVCGVDFWCTTEKWRHPNGYRTGWGLTSFKEYLGNIKKYNAKK